MKRRLKFLWDCFCMISTCVMALIALFTTVVDPTEAINPMVLWQALMVSLLCALSCFIFPWDVVMKKWEVWVRTAIHYVIINLIVLGFGNRFQWYQINNAISLTLMLISIAVVYAIVSCISWRKSKQDAQKMNERLMQYQGKKYSEKK